MGVQIQGDTGNVIATKGTYSGNVTVGGTLTYEDVTNIDSVGLVTARTGIEIGARPGVAASISVDGNMIVSGISTFGGDVQVPDKIIHSGDTNTAIRFPSADTFTVETGGSERFRVDSTGNTLIYGAIRKDNISSSLAISGGNAADSSANIVLHGSSGSPANVTQFRTGSTERLRIKSDGNLQVPIGSNIEIGQIASSSHADGNAGSVLLGIEDGGGAMSGVKVTNVDAGTYNDQIVTFLTAQGGVSTPTERARIDSSGRLLIGTTSHTGHAVSSSNNPKMQLESVSSADYGRASFIYNGNDGVGSGLWFAKSRGTSIGSNTVVANNDQVGGLFFHAADGTDKNSRCASIVVAIDGAPGANDTPGRISFATTPDGSAAAEEKARIPGSTWGLLVTNLSSSGSTGGYQTEGVSLRYSGDSTFVKDNGAAVTMTRKTTAGKVLDFYSTTNYAGGVYVNGANSAQYQSTSDYRLKEDITSMTDGIDKVKLLNPVYYKNKQIGDVTDTTTTQTGFLAHEVQSIIPTLVDGEKDADIDERGKGYQTLNYAGFAPTAIAAIKELIAKVETLESEVAALKSN